MWNELEKDNPSDEKDEIYSHLLKLAKFFTQKNSGLNFRITHDPNSMYSFDVTLWGRRKNLDYLSSIFQTAGLNCSDSNNDIRHEWNMQETNPEEFARKLQNATELITSQYNIPTPSETSDDLLISGNAIIMQKKFGHTEEGYRKLLMWYSSECRKSDSKSQKGLSLKSRKSSKDNEDIERE